MTDLAAIENLARNQVTLRISDYPEVARDAWETAVQLGIVQRCIIEGVYFSRIRDPRVSPRTEVKIPFGRNVCGDMVSIDTVSRGLDCNCVCEECETPLVARKGERNQHHFAHYAEPENCVAARETSIHKFAKGIICKALEVCLPDNLDLGVMQKAELEQWMDGIRPDVLVEFDEPVAIEIFVAHRVPAEKIKTFALRKLAALEIDLSFYRNVDITETEWREIILRTAPRYWLFQPAIVRERIEREAREAARRKMELLVERERKEAEEAAIREDAMEWIAFLQKQEKQKQELERAARERKEAEEAEQEAEWEKVENYAPRTTSHERLVLEAIKRTADTDRHLSSWQLKVAKKC
jgi:hypothetical protein